MLLKRVFFGSVISPLGLRPVARRMLSAATDSLPPYTKLTLPALSPTMTEGGLAKWKKKEGESIKPGEVICEIETDKATVDFEFQEDGTIAKQLVPEGTTGLKVGAVIGIIVDEASSVEAFAKSVFADFNEATPAAAPPKAEQQAEQPKKQESTKAFASKQKDQEQQQKPKSTEQKPKASPSPSKSTSAKSGGQRSSGERLFASPFARRLAREQNKNLNSIKGSGPNGRILAADVLEAKEQAAGQGEGDVTWTLNKLNAPHYYLNVDVDLTEALAACDYLNKSRKDKAPIGINEFVLRAAALSMRKVPEANAAWGDGGSFRMYEYCDVNVSLANASGIIRSPIVRSIHSIGLGDIANELKSIEEKLEKGEELDESDGTFSFINVGSYGVRSIVPIVRPGQATALGIGSVRKALVPSEINPTSAKVTTIATATLSCDHRVVDGAIGAEWLHHFKSLIEKPMSMLL